MRKPSDQYKVVKVYDYGNILVGLLTKSTLIDFAQMQLFNQPSPYKLSMLKMSSEYVFNPGPIMTHTLLLSGQHQKNDLAWVGRGLRCERSWVQFLGERVPFFFKVVSFK